MIQTLDQLRTACAEPIRAKVVVRSAKGDTEIAEIKCRPLSAPQALELLMLENEVKPPNRKATPTAPDSYDYDDPGYLKAKAKVDHQVRCLTLWWCCTLFDEERAKHKDWAADRISEFVVEHIPDANVIIGLTTQINSGMSISERVNFT